MILASLSIGCIDGEFGACEGKDRVREKVSREPCSKKDGLQVEDKIMTSFVIRVAR